MNRLMLAFLASGLLLACQSQAMPTAMPTATPTPTETPIPTETPAPTPTPQATQLPAQPAPAAPLSRLIGQAGQWNVVRVDYPVSSEHSHGLIVGTDQVRVTCIFRRLEGPVPRVNIAFAEELSHRLILGETGEWQGEVNSRTSIGDEEFAVEWLTWVTRTDRLRLRGEDAWAFVRQITETSAPSFRLELPGDPHLSRDYDVTGLGAAIHEGGLTCFE